MHTEANLTGSHFAAAGQTSAANIVGGESSGVITSTRSQALPFASSRYSSEFSQIRNYSSGKSRLDSALCGRGGR
jgi:hypothetical protein